VHHNLANLQGVHDLELCVDTFDLNNSSVVLLTSRSGIDAGLVENEEVLLSFERLLYVGEDLDTLGLEVVVFMVLVVQVLGFGKVRGVVEDGLSLLSNLLLQLSDGVVEVAGYFQLGNLSDLVGGNAVGGNEHDPVVQGQNSLVLLQQLVQLGRLLLVGCLPLLEFLCQDVAKRLVLIEFAIDTLEVLLVLLEDLEEAIHLAEWFPPVILVEDVEATTENVPDITATTNVGRK